MDKATERRIKLKEQMYNYLDESVMQYTYGITDLEHFRRKDILRMWREVAQEYAEALRKVIGDDD